MEILSTVIWKNRWDDRQGDAVLPSVTVQKTTARFAADFEERLRQHGFDGDGNLLP